MGCSLKSSPRGGVARARPARRPIRAVSQSEMLGVRRIAHGYAINLRYTYYGRQPAPYVVEGCTWGYDDGPLSRRKFVGARSCSCPDFQKRRGSGLENCAARRGAAST